MPQKIYKPTVGRPTPPQRAKPIKTGLAGSAPLTGGPTGPLPGPAPKMGGKLPKRPVAPNMGPGFQRPGTGGLDNESAAIPRPRPATAPPKPMNPSIGPTAPKLRIPNGRKGGGPMGFGPTGV